MQRFYVTHLQVSPTNHGSAAWPVSYLKQKCVLSTSVKSTSSSKINEKTSAEVGIGSVSGTVIMFDDISPHRCGSTCQAWSPYRRGELYGAKTY